MTISNKERLFYFSLITLMLLGIVYLFFTGEFFSKEKRVVLENANILKENLIQLNDLNYTQDTLIASQIAAIQDREKQISEALAKGLMTEREAQVKLDSIKSVMETIKASIANKVKEYEIRIDTLYIDHKRKDTIIEFLKSQLGIDHTDYVTISRLKSIAYVLQEDKENLNIQKLLLESDKIDLLTKKNILAKIVDSLSFEIKKNPRPRLVAENLSIRPINRDFVEISVPNGKKDNDYIKIEVKFDISEHSRADYGPRTLTTRYYNPDGTLGKEIKKLDVDFQGQRISDITYLLSSPPYQSGWYYFEIIDDNKVITKTKIKL